MINLLGGCGDDGGKCGSCGFDDDKTCGNGGCGSC